MLHLVGLQMANEVPAYVVGQHGDFIAQFSHAAFTEDALPCIVCLAYRFGRVKFRDGYKLDARRER